MRCVPQTLAIAVFLSACTQFPELDAVVSEQAKRADYLDLVPAEQLLVHSNLGKLSENTGEELQARAKRLQARARILRQITAVNEETRLRIATQLRRLGG